MPEFFYSICNIIKIIRELFAEKFCVIATHAEFCHKQTLHLDTDDIVSMSSKFAPLRTRQQCRTGLVMTA